MAIPAILAPVVMAARNTLAAGRRIIVSTRAFWDQFGLILPDMKREIVRAARAILSASNEIEAGQTAGTVANLFGGQDFPTGDTGGGVFGQPAMTASARFWYTDATGKTTGRQWSRQVPWDMTLDEFHNFMDEEIDRIGGEYGLDGGEMQVGSLILY